MSEKTSQTNKGGRPKGSGAIQIQEIDLPKIESMGALGLNMKQIAAILGISKATLERRASEYPEVQEALERGRAKAVAQVSETAFKMALSGEVPAMTMFYLKCRAGWTEKQHLEITGKDGGAIEVDMTVDEIRRQRDIIIQQLKEPNNGTDPTGL